MRLSSSSSSTFSLFFLPVIFLLTVLPHHIFSSPSSPESFVTNATHAVPPHYTHSHFNRTHYYHPAPQPNPPSCNPPVLDARLLLHHRRHFHPSPRPH